MTWSGVSAGGEHADPHRFASSSLTTTPWCAGDWRLFLKAKPDLQLVGEASGGGEAITLCEQLQPDVVLMDLMMPG